MTKRFVPGEDMDRLDTELLMAASGGIFPLLVPVRWATAVAKAAAEAADDVAGGGIIW